MTYHINEDGTYTIDDEYPFGIPLDGEWSFDEETEILELKPKPKNLEESALVQNLQFTWKILSIDDLNLEVEFKTTGTSIVIIDNPDAINESIRNRSFTRL